MDTSGSSISSLATSEASQILKDLLNVGKMPLSSDSSAASIPGSNANGLLGPRIGGGDASAHGEEMTNNSIDSGATSSNDPLGALMKSMEGPTKQQIILQGDDTSSSFSVYGQEVNVISSKASGLQQSSPGSNKVKINPIVNYEWELRYHTGNIVAVHRDALYIAYVLRGKSGGNVRIINRKTAERALLKGFSGRIIDISFAHLSQVILAAVDEVGNMFVYEVEDTTDGKIKTNLLLQVNRPDNTPPSEYHRVIWCPYIPDDEDDGDDAGKLLVLTHDEKAEMWNVDMVTREYGSGPLLPCEVDVGVLTVSSHKQAITDASFSPDGTALATASKDGYVKFFQVYLHEKSSPRCLHQWKPHDGKPVNSLFFLDDHKNRNPDVKFWKFVITGSDNNCEIKVWSCEFWNCLQTLRFSPPPDLPPNFQIEPCLKAAMDLSANYLVLSDIKRKVLYILQVYQDSTESRAHVSSVSEFLLTQPCMSFHVHEACRKKFKKTTDSEDLGNITTGELEQEEEDHEEGDNIQQGSNVGVIVKLYGIHTKAFQELQIRYQPESSVAAPFPPSSISSMSFDEQGLRDGLTDISMDTIQTESESSILSDRSKDSGHIQPLKPVLLTPDAFTSPRKSVEDGGISTDGVNSSISSSISSFTHVTAIHEESVGTPQSSFEKAYEKAAAAVLSPSSSITLTPTSSKDLSGSNGHLIQTPSSIPLPPVTPSEESKLNILDLSPTPPIAPTGLLEPDGPIATSEQVDDLFMTKPSCRRTLQSTGSSSSTSMEVSEIFSQGDRSSSADLLKKEDPKEEEEEEESATAAGDTIVEEERERQPVAATEEVVVAPPGDGKLKPGEYDFAIWPKPPDVTGEERALQGVEQSEVLEQEEDDVEIEEEKVEEEEEEEEEEVDVNNVTPVPKSESSGPDESMSVSSTLSSPRKMEPPQRHSSPLGSPTRTVAGAAAPVQRSGEVVVIARDHEAIAQLQSSMQQMVELLQKQQYEINDLRGALRQQGHQQESLEIMRAQLQNLEGNLASRVEGALSSYTQGESRRLQNIMNEHENLEKQNQERLLATVTQTLNTTVSQRLDKAVRQEVKNSVVPSVQKVLDPIKDQLHTEMAQKLTATDALLKESIGKMVRSRQTMDTLGAAAASAIQGPIQTAYRDIFQSTVLPSFDKACQGLFMQVNESFQRGTKDYIQQLESHMERVRRKHQESRDPAVAQLTSATTSLQSSIENLEKRIISSVQTEIGSQLHGALGSLQDTLVGQVHKVVKDELAEAMKEQQISISENVLNAVRSSTATPIPTPPDPQALRTHLLQLLGQGQLNTAFQQALSASDLQLVMFVCENVNPGQVFNQTPCPLQQPVLLSLIQQLSADLTVSTELKHKYLEEAIMNLDTSHTITREHMPTVLSALCQKLLTFVQQNPQDPHARAMRMLLMASQSLLK